MSARLRLRRSDGQVYLDRWGFEHERLGGIFLHRMTAGDPGLDLHDHPWWFASFTLVGGYVEQKAESREAVALAVIAENFPDTCAPAPIERRRMWTWKSMRLDQCHRITELTGRSCWTLVIHGPWRRRWGFFLPTGWIDDRRYDTEVRGERAASRPRPLAEPGRRRGGVAES